MCYRKCHICYHILHLHLHLYFVFIPYTHSTYVIFSKQKYEEAVRGSKEIFEHNCEHNDGSLEPVIGVYCSKNKKHVNEDGDEDEE